MNNLFNLVAWTHGEEVFERPWPLSFTVGELSGLDSQGLMNNIRIWQGSILYGIYREILFVHIIFVHERSLVFCKAYEI